MARPLPVTSASHFSHPELQVGRQVRILSGDHRGVNGRVIAREWDDGQTDWLYFVKNGRMKYGPYLVRELW